MRPSRLRNRRSGALVAKSLIAGLVALHCRDGQAITSSARTRTACGIFADGRREVWRGRHRATDV